MSAPVTAPVIVLVSLATIFITVIFPVFVPAFVAASILVLTVLLPVARHVFVVVPVVLYKIDSLAACVVLAAVATPVFCMSRRYAQIDGRSHCRDTLDYPWPTINNGWLIIVPDIESAVETGLAYADRYANIGAESGEGGS